MHDRYEPFSRTKFLPDHKVRSGESNKRVPNNSVADRQAQGRCMFQNNLQQSSTCGRKSNLQHPGMMINVENRERHQVVDRPSTTTGGDVASESADVSRVGGCGTTYARPAAVVGKPCHPVVVKAPTTSYKRDPYLTSTAATFRPGRIQLSGASAGLRHWPACQMGNMMRRQLAVGKTIVWSQCANLARKRGPMMASKHVCGPSPAEALVVRSASTLA